MGDIKSVSPTSGRQLPTRRDFLGHIVKGGVVTGIVGAGAYTGVRQQGQIKELKDKVLTNEFSMQNMSAQIDRLNRESNTKITLEQVRDTVKKTTPSTVRVEGSNGLGSGVILITPYGRYILTNGHVTVENDFRNNAEGDGVYHVKLYNGTDFSSAEEFDAPPVILKKGQRAYSPPPEHDLALLQIPPDVQLPSGAGVILRDLEKDPVDVGEPVIAVGNPFGEKDSVTFGIISHVDRVSSLNQNHHFQIDAPINPGNSGGGSFDMQGRLIGINTWGYRGGDGIAGAIRIDEVMKMLKTWGVH